MVIGYVLVAYVKICEYFWFTNASLNELIYITEQRVY